MISFNRIILLASLGVIFCSTAIDAQVAINNDGALCDPSAILDVESDTAGILIPRMTDIQRLSISSPATGLLIYNTDTKSFFHYDGTTWIEIVSQAETIDLDDLLDVAYYSSNLFIGEGAGYNGGTGTNNTAVGKNSMWSIQDGHSNTSMGKESLYSNTSGVRNVAIGWNAMNQNLSGNDNTSIGCSALHSNASGDDNTAVGGYAMYSNNGGYCNTAIGYNGLYQNSEGADNIAVGYEALKSNMGNHGSTAVGTFAMKFADNRITGRYTCNTAVGFKALYGSTSSYNNTGRWNTALGHESLTLTTSGDNNTGVGSLALFLNSTGSNNTAVGKLSLRYNQSGYQNTAIGCEAGYSSLGDGNIFIGYKAGYSITGDNKLYIDNNDNAMPLIYGDFSTRRVGIGSITADSRLDVRSPDVTMDPLRVRVGSATKFRVHGANGSVSVGTSSEGPENGLESLGNIEPNTHMGADLGADGKAWDDIYYDDLHNQGASAFEGRNVLAELLAHPPAEKAPGSFDYLTDRGDVELDPASLPEGLADENSLLTDEIGSFNYKTNYEQQRIIEKLLEENRILKSRLDELEKRLKKTGESYTHPGK